MYQRRFATKKAIKGNMEYRKWDDYEIGDIVVGKFVGMHHCQFEKENPKISVLEAFFKDGSGAQLTGKTLVLNSCGTLDSAMKEIKEGDLIQLEYTGKVALTKGKFAGKEAHTMNIETVEEVEEDSSEDDGL
jgi:hypothetical protein